MSSEKQELVRKVQALVRQRFSGSYEQAFRHYARAKNDPASVNGEELKLLLADARVGNSFTRGMWVDGIIEQVDGNRNGTISWTEFQRVIS